MRPFFLFVIILLGNDNIWYQLFALGLFVGVYMSQTYFFTFYFLLKLLNLSQVLMFFLQKLHFLLTLDALHDLECLVRLCTHLFIVVDVFMQFIYSRLENRT